MKRKFEGNLNFENAKSAQNKNASSFDKAFFQ